jgi:Asp-tRNA(Asn)/Glu-tRNA(Gln) amidotransferase A subunit family amidase
MAKGEAELIDFRSTGVVELQAAFKAKRLKPSDVAKACVERIARLDPTYKAWAIHDDATVMRLATEADQRLAAGEALRPLEGVPVGVKDIFNTIDFPTEMGSPTWKGFTPGNDARVVFNVKRAGAIVVGKTRTAEFAVHALPETLNPHDPTRNPGTSSTGSAVAIALGQAPVTLGTQTAGSIIRPASFCGVYGCKPTFGSLPRTGILKTTDTLDSVGFFVSRAEDLAAVFDALRVHGRDYPLIEKYYSDPARCEKPASRPWKIGIARPHVWSLAEDYAKAAFDGWIAKLAGQSDIEIKEITLPSELAQGHEIHRNIYHRCLTYYFQREFGQSELISPLMREIVAEGESISNETYRQALAEQDKLTGAMDACLADYDVMLTLSTAGAAPLREVSETPDSALLWTLTGLPAVSAPVFIAPDGMPFGAQIVSRRYNDRLLFAFISDLCSRELLPVGPHLRLTF